MEVDMIMETERLLTWKSMSMIAICNLGFEKEDLENIWAQQEHDVSRYKREVIRQWPYKGDKQSKLQKFADILYDSEEVYHEDVKTILKVDRSNDPVVITEPKSRRKMSTRKLGQLADSITNRAMETIALRDLKVKFAKVDNKRYAGNGYWWFNLTILVDYLKKPDSTPEKLKEILLESGEVDRYEVEGIFDDESSAQEGTSEVDTEPSTSCSPAAEPTTSEVDGSMQPREESIAGQQTGNSTFEAIPASTKLLGFAALIILVVAGYFVPDIIRSILETLCVLTVTVGPILVGVIFLVREDPSIAESSRYVLPAGSWFPKGRPCKNLPSYYKWLNFDKIRKRKDLWENKTKPVVVAVLDTGMYEDHKDLKGKILTDQSMCFLTDEASQKDLRKDRRGHGTMVAGIIALYGPENVKIINLKVLPADEKDDNLDATVEALDYVKDLTIKDSDGREYGVDIVNMSLGQFECRTDLDDKLLELAGKKIVIAAAGNEGKQKSNAVNYPAKNANVIAVGAHDMDGNITGSSSKGPEVNILCPGEAVASTRSYYKKEGIRDYILGMWNPYYVANGTSFSSPYAAAVAAYVLVVMEVVRGPDDRKKFCASAVMMRVLEKLSDKERPGVLRAHENGIEDINDLYGHCDKALKG